MGVGTPQHNLNDWLDLLTAFASDAKEELIKKRFKRFFNQFEIDSDEQSRTLADLANIPESWTLNLDQTHWSLGSAQFNILMLGVMHQRIAFPLIWKMLEKQDNSNSSERMDLFDRLDRLFGHVRLDCLTAQVPSST